MKLGIIGCGLIGNKRAAAARSLGLEIAAACDKNSELAGKLAKEYSASVIAEWQDLCALDIDIVIVCTSHDMLSEIAELAVKSGKHVLVEKPGGRSLREVEAVSRAANSCNKLVKVGFNHRFHPAAIKAREILDTGDVGNIFTIRGRYGHGGRIGYDQEWRFEKEISGGGELIDQGSHLVDLSRWYMGELNLDYSLLPSYFWSPTVEDNCFLALKGENNSMAWLHASWSEWKNSFCLEIYGKNAKLQIDGLGGSYGTESLTYFKMLPEMGPPETTKWEYPGPDLSWQRELQNMIEAIAGRTGLIGSIDDAVALHAIVGAAYERAETADAVADISNA